MAKEVFTVCSMADLDDIMREFAHLQEAYEQQQEAQRAQQRREQESETFHREDRARRGGAGSPTGGGVVFVVGNKVLHDLLGEAFVRKPPRSDDAEGKLVIEWTRPGKSKKDPPIVHNR